MCVQVWDLKRNHIDFEVLGLRWLATYFNPSIVHWANYSLFTSTQTMSLTFSKTFMLVMPIGTCWLRWAPRGAPSPESWRAQSTGNTWQCLILTFSFFLTFIFYVYIYVYIARYCPVNRQYLAMIGQLATSANGQSIVMRSLKCSIVSFSPFPYFLTFINQLYFLSSSSGFPSQCFSFSRK